MLCAERRQAMKISPCRLQLSAPSTSANLGPGFDCLGLALNQRNIWVVSVLPGNSPGRCRVVESTGGGANEEIPVDENHLFFSSWTKLHQMSFGPDLFLLLKDQGFEIELRAENKTPIARGLGSSAAVRVASAEVYRRLTGAVERPAWELAAQLETHPDNAGSAGLGGLFIGTRDQSGRFRALQPTVHECWRVVVAIPDFSLHTAKARACLPTEIPRADSIFNTGRLPFLLEGLRTGDQDFLHLGCQDRLHQNQRASLIPGFHQVMEAAAENGAAASYLSGAGPTMAAFVDGRRGAELAGKVARSMKTAFEQAGVSCTTEVLEIDQAGLQVMELEPEGQIA